MEININPLNRKESIHISASNRLLRHAGQPHDLEGVMAIGRRQHNLTSPGEYAQYVAVALQSFKFGSIGTAKTKADFEESNAQSQSMTRPETVGSLASGGEHFILIGKGAT